MSVQAISWALRQKVGQVNAKLVLLSLANRAGFDNTCFPGLQTLCSETELARRTILYALKELCDLGLITRQPRRRDDGSQTTTLYLLNVDDGQVHHMHGGVHPEVSRVQLRAPHEPSLEPSKREPLIEGKKAKAPRVHILIDTPQWKAWCKFLKKTPPHDKRFGWEFDSEWPPGHEPKSEAA